MKLFAMDSPLMEGLRKLADVIICNLLFLLCSLPIITLGASLAALYESMGILIADTDNGLIFIDFFKAFKRHFKRATLLWILALLAAGLLRLYYKVVCSLGGGMQKMYTVTFYVILILLALTLQFLVPMLIYRKDKIFKTISNAVVLSIVALPWTMAAVGVFGASILLSSMIWQQGGYIVLFIWMMAGFGLLAYFKQLMFGHAIGKMGLECQNERIMLPEDITEV